MTEQAKENLAIVTCLLCTAILAESIRLTLLSGTLPPIV